MATDSAQFPMSENWVFAVLRTLTLLGGMIALFLGPIRPEHQLHLYPLAWAFVAYQALQFLAIRLRPARLPQILLATIGLDLLFVSLFVWFSGGFESHFYLLYHLLVALVAAHFGPEIGLATAAGASLLYGLVSWEGTTGFAWPHLGARAATLLLLGGALGYLSRRERVARSEAERLNQDLQKNQERLEKAYEALQAAQERMVQAERLAIIGQMSAKVSHEVRNPLSSISLNTELLEDELGGLPAARRDEAARLVTAIRSQVEVLSAVTEEYLRFARLPKPKLELGSVAPVIEDLAEFVREELRGRKVDLLVEVADGLSAIRMDAGQIRQALLNLVRNAAEAMPGGGSVRIETQVLDAQGRGAGEPGRRGAKGDAVEIAVRDTGPGIPAGAAEKIFEPFFTSKEGGTGLGLAIARQIALDHGGTLACESPPGGGAIFRLTLPIPTGGDIP